MNTPNHPDAEALLRAYGITQVVELARMHAPEHVQAVLRYVDLQPGVKSKPALAVKLLRERFIPPAPVASKGAVAAVPPDWTDVRRRREAAIDALPERLVWEAVAAIVRAITPAHYSGTRKGAVEYLRGCGRNRTLLMESTWWRESICEYGPAARWVVDAIRLGGGA